MAINILNVANGIFTLAVRQNHIYRSPDYKPLFLKTQ